MSEQHRPGPWTYDRWGQLTDAKGWVIGDIEDDADGKLAAASPDMLYALRQVWDDHAPDMDPATRHAVRAAVRKAEGRPV